MHSSIVANEASAPARPAWRAVWSLGLGVFGLIIAEFLPASLLTAMGGRPAGCRGGRPAWAPARA